MRCKLDDFLNEEKEKMAWSKIEDDVRAAGQLMLTDEREGKFVLRARPSGMDFFITGSLHTVRIVDEGVFERMEKNM
ncbi:hypothetical protein CFE70_001444 [Pyrenophora teres f. teres 0-1]